jgi:hypothetical protein
MKPHPELDPCELSVPEPLIRAEAQAQRRAEDAISRVLKKLDVNGRGTEIERLIGADVAVEATKRNGK